MNLELLDRWIEAIETGEYNKAEGTYYNMQEDSHCAIGVLAEVMLDDGVAFELLFDGTLSHNSNPILSGDPNAITSIVGLSSDSTESLIAWNDSSEGWDGVLGYLKFLRSRYSDY